MRSCNRCAVIRTNSVVTRRTHAFGTHARMTVGGPALSRVAVIIALHRIVDTFGATRTTKETPALLANTVGRARSRRLAFDVERTCECRASCRRRMRRRFRHALVVHAHEPRVTGVVVAR